MLEYTKFTAQLNKNYYFLLNIYKCYLYNTSWIYITLVPGNITTFALSIFSILPGKYIHILNTLILKKNIKKFVGENFTDFIYYRRENITYIYIQNSKTTPTYHLLNRRPLPPSQGSSTIYTPWQNNIKFVWVWGTQSDTMRSDAPFIRAFAWEKYENILFVKSSVR